MATQQDFRSAFRDDGPVRKLNLADASVWVFCLRKILSVQNPFLIDNSKASDGRAAAIEHNTVYDPTTLS